MVLQAFLFLHAALGDIPSQRGGIFAFFGFVFRMFSCNCGILWVSFLKEVLAMAVVRIVRAMIRDAPI